MSSFRTQFEVDYYGTPGEVNTLPSKTVPDQSLSIQQLMLNHTRGIQSEVAEREELYLEDVEIPLIHDINDLMDYRRDLEMKQKYVEDEIKRHSRSNSDIDSSDSPDSGEDGSGKEGTEPSEVK